MRLRSGHLAAAVWFIPVPAVAAGQDTPRCSGETILRVCGILLEKIQAWLRRLAGHHAHLVVGRGLGHRRRLFEGEGSREGGGRVRKQAHSRGPARLAGGYCTYERKVTCFEQDDGDTWCIIQWLLDECVITGEGPECDGYAYAPLDPPWGALFGGGTVWAARQSPACRRRPAQPAGLPAHRQRVGFGLGP